MVSGIITLLLLALFLGAWAWAWQPSRKPEFEAASRLALEEPAATEPASHEEPQS